MRRSLALLLLLAACRERADIDGKHGAAAHAVGATPRTTPAPTEATRMYLAAPSSFVDLVAHARHGVVAIRSTTPVKSGPAAMFPGAPETTADVALGTGFLIDLRAVAGAAARSDASALATTGTGVYVVTTEAIASAATELQVVLDDTTVVPAKVVGRDLDLDLALLAVDRPNLRPLPTGVSNDIKLGEWIAVLGNPFGEEVTAAVGIVSSTGREAAGSLMQDRGMSYRAFRMLMQTDARIHRGNSGGPVLDTAGQVIGMAIATSDRVGELSFVLPIDRIRDVVEALRDHGSVSRSWLGVKVQPLTSDLAATLGLTPGAGAYVTEVMPSSPALRSSLRAGDVILRWNERPVDHRSLPWLVAATAVGKPNAVVVWRNKVETVVPVITEKMPQ